jgi:Phytanoyl-CoA dioxygenase (PhyH)
MSTTEQRSGSYDVNALVDGLYGDGIIGLKGAFPREWAQQLREDVDAQFEDAINRPHGAVGRGPKRYYVEIHPQGISGFIDLVTHPWVVAVSEAVLGPDWQVVEIGFDTPFPGAKNQPWHRDFPAPIETTRDHRLTSLAFNLTTVDVIPEMGPFQIAPGTQWEHGPQFRHGMFPPKDDWPRYEAMAQAKLPQMGDISARSALTIHRGTANVSEFARPVVVLGVDAPGAGNAERHDVQVTPDFEARLPEWIRPHIDYRVVDELVPIEQRHTIEDLVMGAP